MLLKLELDLDDLSLYPPEIDLPLLPLLLNEVLLLLELFLEPLLLVLGHVLLLLRVHPVLSHKFLFQLVLLFLHDQLISAHHVLETSLSEVVALEESFTFSSLPLLFLEDGALFLG